MSLIITATDFSQVGNNAVRYACHMAESQGAKVIVMHTFIFPVMFSDIPLPTSLVNEAQDDAEQHMKSLVADLKNEFPTLHIHGKVDYGDIINTLDNFTKSNIHPWLIVIGNSAVGEKAAWPDNTIIDALKTLKYPVLAVPPETSFQPIKKICFAFDNKHKGNEKAISQLTMITKCLGAELHVLNAQPEVPVKEMEASIDDDVKQVLSGTNPQYHIVYDADIDASIQNFIEQNNIDWLVLLPRKHSFFEGLFHKSHTKAIAHKSHVPIVALHEN
jgi:nucleotide-binding universal stress UspA family protein